MYLISPTRMGAGISQGLGFVRPESDVCRIQSQNSLARQP